MPSVAFLSSEVVSTRTLYDRAQQSEPPGPKPKTPMIAGATIGSVMGVAYLIGFTIYFYKRWKRKKLNRQIEAGQATPKVRPEPKEKVVIPPDPAVLLGQHEGGEYVHVDEKRRFSHHKQKSVGGAVNGATGSTSHLVGSDMAEKSRMSEEEGPSTGVL